jgi:hypothetical protein
LIQLGINLWVGCYTKICIFKLCISLGFVWALNAVFVPIAWKSNGHPPSTAIAQYAENPYS